MQSLYIYIQNIYIWIYTYKTNRPCGCARTAGHISAAFGGAAPMRSGGGWGGRGKVAWGNEQASSHALQGGRGNRSGKISMMHESWHDMSHSKVTEISLVFSSETRHPVIVNHCMAEINLNITSYFIFNLVMTKNWTIYMTKLNSIKFQKQLNTPIELILPIK
jgi:hypothetical protein